MFVTSNKYLALPCLQIWWPRNDAEVVSRLGDSPTLHIMQCDAETGEKLAPWSFRRKTFSTVLIDLCQSEMLLWDGLDRKSCRRYIRTAEKSSPMLCLNEHFDDAFQFLNDFLNRKKYRKPMHRAEWVDLIRFCDVFSVRQQERLVAVHLVHAADRARARLLMSARIAQDDSQYAMSGAMNRWLHWQEFCYYRRESYKAYDFGGVDLDHRSPLYGIGQFKRSFGGRIVREEILRLASNPALRSVLRIGAQARTVLSSWSRRHFYDAIAQQKQSAPVR